MRVQLYIQNPHGGPETYGLRGRKDTWLILWKHDMETHVGLISKCLLHLWEMLISTWNMDIWSGSQIVTSDSSDSKSLMP